MIRFRISLLMMFLLILSGITNLTFAQKTPAEHARIFGEGKENPDIRLKKLRTLRDAYHPWKPVGNIGDWELQSKLIRNQLKLSNGLLPEWKKTPLNAVVHGEIHRGDYIVQRVYFESMPGHFVTGNLYRPVKIEGQVPGVLCPHGHWADARFFDAGEKTALQSIEDGGEKYLSGGRHHIQARMVHLARMGCIVFHYDMVGYADSKVIDHRADFADVEAGNWLINTMGLQTWNSIRALDFLCSLDHVDQNRIAVTGASGGGTQTFMLGALDDRVDVAFPAVMVSTAMQGGCVCENADYLRIGINNVAIAALFAPKPLAMTGANDWTIDIESKGLPELKQVYSLYNKASNVYAEAHPEFGHNYNYVSRAIMYRWMAEHLDLPDAPLVETDFWPIPKEELTVFDDEHPLPESSKSAAELRAWMIGELKKYRQQMKVWSKENFEGYKSEMGQIVFTLFDTQRMMKWGERDSESESKTHIHEEVILNDQIRLEKAMGTSKDLGISVISLKLSPKNASKTVYWFDEKGKSHLFDETGAIEKNVQRLLDAGYEVISIDSFLTGESKSSEWSYNRPVDEKYSGYTYGYNAPTLVERMYEIKSLLPGSPMEKEIIVVGTGDAGLWTLLASVETFLGSLYCDRLIVNIDGFKFANIESISDPNFLPGAVRYGDIGGFAALVDPKHLRSKESFEKNLIVGGVAEDSETGQMLKLGVAGRKGKLQLEPQDLSRKEIVDLILSGK